MEFHYSNRQALAKILEKNVSAESLDTLEFLWENDFNNGKVGFTGKRTLQLLRQGEYQWALALLFSESDKILYPEESEVWKWFMASTNSH